MYTSGTGGPPSVIQRDMRQCLTGVYTFQKLMAAMWDDDLDHSISFVSHGKKHELGGLPRYLAFSRKFIGIITTH